MGIGSRSYTRAVNSQVCIRVSGKHNDLEEVGRDTTHQTLFEMLGNWSFGDYYKKEAIGWAWELLTSVYGLPKKKLYATVFVDDSEAYDLWRSETDIDPDHVIKFGEKENFWEMADTRCFDDHDINPIGDDVTRNISAIPRNFIVTLRQIG